MELSNAYSELNDPVLQRRLVEEQVESRARGDEEAMPHNELFLRRLNRHAAVRRPGHWPRPSRHAAHQPAVDPRRDCVPAGKERSFGSVLRKSRSRAAKMEGNMGMVLKPMNSLDLASVMAVQKSCYPPQLNEPIKVV